MELSLGGIQYLYKAGAKIEEPGRQISLEEAIISQRRIRHIFLKMLVV